MAIPIVRLPHNSSRGNGVTVQQIHTKMAGSPPIAQCSEPVQARHPSCAYQCHQWWKNLKPQRQEQSAHCFYLRMKKSGTLISPSRVAGSGSHKRQLRKQRYTGGTKKSLGWFVKADWDLVITVQKCEARPTPKARENLWCSGSAKQQKKSAV